MNADVTKTTTVEKGHHVNTQTGESTSPAGQKETTQGLNILLEDTPRNREIFAKVLEASGQPAEAATLRGQTYQPTFGKIAKNVITSNTSLLKVGVGIAIGGVVIWAGRKALKLLAEKMGWNMFGNNVSVSTDVEMEKRETRTSSVRRAPTGPTQMSATA